jgi:hypothetical protein
VALDDEEEAVAVVLDDATRTQPRGWSSRAGIVEAEKRERRAKARSEEVKKNSRFFFFWSRRVASLRVLLPKKLQGPSLV